MIIIEKRTIAEIQDLTFSYDGQIVLKNLSFNIFEEEFLCILGKSGCGKSTFLRLLSGLYMPDSGFIYYEGKEIKEPSTDITMVFQDYSLFPWMTNGQNVEIAIEQVEPNLSKEETKRKANEYLDSVGLGGMANKYPSELSGGMQQRAAIARSVALKSHVLLMDEPFGALDIVTRNRLQDMTKNLWSESIEQKMTIVFVTHDVEEAIKLGKRILVFGVNAKGIIKEINVDDYSDKDVLKEELISTLINDN